VENGGGTGEGTVAASFIGGGAQVNRRGPLSFPRRNGRAMGRLMGEKRTETAVARIERALARIEAAASRPRPAADDGALRATHEALRGKVETAIRQIDQLLISAERG
jgi:hypothetical protein